MKWVDFPEKCLGYLLIAWTVSQSITTAVAVLKNPYPSMKSLNALFIFWEFESNVSPLPDHPFKQEESAETISV